MISSATTGPSLEAINQPAFDHILSVYPDVLQSFYLVKVKSDETRHRLALEDDKWRYEQLPSKLERLEKGRSLSKDELERLVRWKITHQTNRPFLLPQIRKNDPGIVAKCTADAYELLSAPNPSTATTLSQSLPRENITKALDIVCELKGVGPATGTLILSVYDGQNIPFFEDELYAWLLPGSHDKLKYNMKEYLDLLDKFQKSVTTPASAGGDSATKQAMAYEKVAFVCQHWDHVDVDQRKAIEEKLAAHQPGKSDDPRGTDGGEDMDAGQVVTIAKVNKGLSSDNSSKKRKSDVSKESTNPSRRSKRNKN